VDVLGLKVYDNPANIIKVDGNSQRLYHAVNLKFRIAGVLTKVKACVIEGTMSFTVLLGRPWMMSTNLQGDYGANMYYLQDENDEVIRLAISGSSRNIEETMAGKRVLTHPTRGRREVKADEEMLEEVMENANVRPHAGTNSGSWMARGKEEEVNEDEERDNVMSVANLQPLKSQRL
jgi:hypothetical protein